jgi:hypothetical protein
MFNQLRRLAGRADALVIDCNLSWALQSRVARRTAVLVHTSCVQIDLRCHRPARP